MALIRQHGLLSTQELSRQNISVPQMGGNSWSLEADQRVGMHEYVHLCFINDHPMEFKAKNEQRIENSIFLKINPEIIKVEGVKITLDVSNQSGIVAEPAVAQLDKLDLEIIYKRTDWKVPENNARLQKAKRFEILIPRIVPVRFIENLGNG